MLGRERKKKDFSQIALEVAEAATGAKLSPRTKPTKGKKPEKAKNPAAVALGKLGASKGGKARAEKLSKKRKWTIAIRAAQIRWAKE